jgi:hypothetical protein
MSTQDDRPPSDSAPDDSDESNTGAYWILGMILLLVALLTWAWFNK